MECKGGGRWSKGGRTQLPCRQAGRQVGGSAMVAGDIRYAGRRGGRLNREAGKIREADLARQGKLWKSGKEGKKWG